MAEAVKDEPRAFLCDLQILGQSGARDTFFVRRDQPDCGEPLAERKLRIFENGANFD